MTHTDDYDAVRLLSQLRPDDFVAEMAREHRTNQQKFTGLCLAWLHHLSELEEYEFDGRNERAVAVAKKIRAATTYDREDNPDGEIWPIRLPLI